MVERTPQSNETPQTGANGHTKDGRVRAGEKDTEGEGETGVRETTERPNHKHAQTHTRTQKEEPKRANGLAQKSIRKGNYVQKETYSDNNVMSTMGDRGTEKGS